MKANVIKAGSIKQNLINPLSLIRVLGMTATLFAASTLADVNAIRPKPGAPVALVSQPAVQLQPGESRLVSLVLEVGSTSSLTIQVMPDSGLQIAAEEQHFEFLQPGTRVAFELQVSASQAGRYGLMFNATTGDGLSRVLGIAVEVGSDSDRVALQKAAAPPAPRTLSDGTRVRWMRAE